MYNIDDYHTKRPIIVPSARPSIHSYRISPPTALANMVTYGLGKNNGESDDSGNEQTVDEVDNVLRPYLRKPSARPSIHRYRDLLASTTNLVDQGLCDHKQSGDSGNEGIDEVDNVISKPAHPIRSPSKRQYQKRNSLSLDKDLYTEDDSDALSKSVPANLPSYLHYSDDSNEETANRYHSNVSYHSAVSPDRSNRSGSYAPSPQILETSRTNKEQTQSNSLGIITLLSIIGLILAVFLSNINLSSISNESVYDEFRFYTDLSGLGEKYNVDENSILQVQTGISTIAQKQDTGSFMFVYNSNSDSFNVQEFNKFMHDVSFAASKYLRNDSSPIHYTTVEGTKLNMAEHGELVGRYRDDLARTGLMLVKHLEQIPAYLAMAFHYYCDEYNPLVKKSAIFFTMNLAQCPVESDKKMTYHAVIEKCLAQKWSDVPIDNIGPLLTRVVNVIIDVTTQ